MDGSLSELGESSQSPNVGMPVILEHRSPQRVPSSLGDGDLDYY